MNAARHKRLLPTYLACGAFLAGCVYSLILGDALRYPDETQYVTIGRSLAFDAKYSLDGVHPTAFRVPGWTAIVALILRVTGSLVATRIVNFALFSATLILISKITRRWHGDTAAIAAVLIAGAYGVLFYTAGTLYPQTLAAFLFVLVVYMLTQPLPTTGRAAVGGALFGWLSLTVSTFLAALPMALLLDRLRSADRRRSARRSLAFCAACGLVVTPWIARNAAQLGQATIATNVGFNLLKGNSPQTTASNGVTADTSVHAERAVGMSEVERNVRFTRSAVGWIRSHPWKAAQLYGLKLANHFNYRNQLRTSSESSLKRDLMMAVTFYGMLALVGLRLWWGASLRKEEAILAAAYLLFAAASAVFFTRIRFRLPTDYILVLLAAGLVSTRSRRWRGYRSHS